MAELSTQERLQPFLLDRLSDDQPTVKQESREKRVLSPREYRRAVLRDLSWLLNSASHPPTDRLEDYPEVAKSVLNYGMPELAGTTASNLTPEQVERMVRNAILVFEPRILRQSLRISAVEVLEEEGSNLVQLEIRGEVWNLPMPESLYIRTEVDLDTGHCELKDQLHGG
jgi:type VI secretion system protein ImpF